MVALLEPGGEDAEGRCRSRGWRCGEVVAGYVVYRVAALGDGERHDLGGRVGDGREQTVGAGGGVNEVDDAADDLDLGGLGPPGDEGIEVVLRS